MIFSSPAFLFYFLPAVLAIYFLARPGWRNAVLLLTGLMFYVWGAGSFVFVLILSIIVNWALGLLAGRAARHPERRLRAAVVAVDVVFNLALLGYFKYANFLVAQLNEVGHRLGGVWPLLPIPAVVLPIGISFITFQAISYVVDVSRGEVQPLTNPVDYGMYIAMFPHSIAGPIVRFRLIAAQIRDRAVSWDGFCSGMVRFAHGLVKKILIADTIATIADKAFEAGGGTPVLAWLGAVAFTLQAYFDFSAYSDMAIGLGRVFGFTFPENFDRPLSAVSFTDFWRRWHITLSEWFRDYVYFPLGGSRTSSWKVYRNLVLVFTLVGFWHGANWTFLIFGAYHGFWLCVERATGKRFPEDMRHPGVHRVVTLTLIVIGMVMFRARNVTEALAYYRAMFGLVPAAAWTSWIGTLNGSHYLALAVGVASLFLPSRVVVGRMLDAADTRLAHTLRIAIPAAGLIVALIFAVSGNFTPFIYFRF